MRVVRAELEIPAVLGVETSHAAVALRVTGRLLQLHRLGDDPAPVFLEVGGFAEGGQRAGCGVVGGNDDRGGSRFRDCEGWRFLRDYHGLEYLSARSGKFGGLLAHMRWWASGLRCRCRRRGNGQARACTRDARRRVLRDEGGERGIALVLRFSGIGGVHRSCRSDGNCICWGVGSAGLAKSSE